MKMNWKKIIGIVAGFAIVALVVLKLKNNKEVTQSKVYQYDKEKAIHVQADTLQNEYVNAEFSYSGTFEPNKETKISAELQGKINIIFVDAGAYVHKGQKLIQLDNTLLRHQLNLIDVQIQNAKTESNVQLQANQIQLNAVQLDVERYKVLAQADAIQGVQLEKAEQQLETAKNQRIALLQQANLKSAEAQRKSIVEQINKTVIYSPFNGVVTAKLAEIGSFAAPSIPILQITDIQNLKFTVNIPETELRQFQLNNSYSISSDAYPEISLIGKATMIGSKANMGSSFPVQFSVNNTSDLKIKSGMFGKLNMRNANQEKSIIIPTSAIVGSANQPQVYLVKNGKSSLQNITILKKIQNKAVVSSGLNDSDVIVTNGFINLFDGANIIVK
ncbi:MAG: efflux RND transporter periplasmic adaptor subunit [Flavobacterium sp.]|nr:efflux RND transporter periplasmic adaptor subunit [Flavobacterium sp.]